MGAGSSSSRVFEAEEAEIEARDEVGRPSKRSSKQPEEILVNKTKVGPEKTKDATRKSRQSAEKTTLSVREPEPKTTEKDSVVKTEYRVSKTLESTKLKLAERGYKDENLIKHCDKNPSSSETYISVYDALKSLQKEIEKKDFASNLEVQRQTTFISSSYSRQGITKRKIALGEFLADIGFAKYVKDVFLKLEAAFPTLFSYDRELDTSGATEEKPDTDDLKKAQDLLNTIVLASINYTDLCDAMNLAFNEVGLVQILVASVDKLKDCTAQHVQYMDSSGTLKKKTIRGSYLSRIMGTLHNLSKRVPTRVNFHACNAVRIVLPLIDDKVTLYATKALLLLAYLIDESNNNLIMASKAPIKYLISLIDKATQRQDHRYLGFSNSELAEGLAQIAINDSNKKQIVANGAIPVLTRMLKAAKNEEEQSTASEAVWVLAFDEENKQDIKNNESCMELLHKLKESDNDRVKKAASGALWEIEGKQKHSESSNTDGKSSSATTNHVMISYQWDVQKTLIQVKDRLQAAGYRVWMDLEQMGGSTLEAMAKAVENSAVVLVCVSQKYKESSNCRSEAEYAFQLHKDIIPLMMENNYRPDGWLGMIMGSKLWIDFSQRHGRLDPSMKDLQKELGERGKSDVEELVRATSVDEVDAKPTIDISGWTHRDVTNWMKGFGLVMKKKKNCVPNKLTGPVLTRLYSLRNESPDFYYSSLKNDIGLSDVFDVLLFTDELEKLVG